MERAPRRRSRRPHWPPRSPSSCTAFTPTYPGNMMLGYSEGVMTAAFLIAARARLGRPSPPGVRARASCPASTGPEVWPMWGLYGLWLMWRDRGARLLVVGLGVLMLALWVVPQKLGGGSGGILGLAYSRAEQPLSEERRQQLVPVLERARLHALAAGARAPRVRLAGVDGIHRLPVGPCAAAAG